MPTANPIKRLRARLPGVGGWAAALGASQSKIIDQVVSIAAALLAVAGVVGLFGSSSTVGRVLAGLSAASSAAAISWLLRRQQARSDEVLTAELGVRLLLLFVPPAIFLFRSPTTFPIGSSTSDRLLWLAAGLGLAMVLVEPALKQALSRTEQIAVGLPGVKPIPAPPFRSALLVLASLVVAVGGGLLAALGAPVWSYLLLTGGYAGVVAILVAYAIRANRICRRSLAALPKALRRYRPEFVVYYGGSHGARYQLGMWLPYLERLGRKFVVITREAATVPTICSLTEAPVLVPRTSSSLGDLDSYVVPSMRAAFYVQGSRANLQFQKFRQLTHIWLNHGDSDKQANFSARHSTYDKVLVCGRQGVDRYAAHGVRMKPGQLVQVGRPQVERIEVRDWRLPATAPRTVLYAPTWRGGRPSTNHSSLPLGESIVAALLQRAVTVIFRPHPLSYSDPGDAGMIRSIQRLLAADRQQTGRQHVCGAAAERDWDIPDCLNAADALVTDVSSVASDNLASGKPVAMVAIRAAGKKFTATFPMARVAYVIESDLSTLDTALDELLAADSLAERRWEYRRYCLGGQLGERAADEFLRVAGLIVSGKADSVGLADDAAGAATKPLAIVGEASRPASKSIEEVIFPSAPDVADLVADDAGRSGPPAHRSGQVA